MASATLDPAHWRDLALSHARRADALTAARRDRAITGTSDEVEDFLFTYYPVRPGILRRWHPGAGVWLVLPDDQTPPESESTVGADSPAPSGAHAPGATDRWYTTTTTNGATLLGLDIDSYLADRGDATAWIHQVLTRTATRKPSFGCFGLHEWAMVYRQDTHRHPLPLRIGQEATDALVEESAIQCSHFDAFRFFTPAARPLNLLQPTPESRLTLDQPGCLHANMDLLRHALKLGPAVPGNLLLDCFELARDVRVLDMEASPYDVRGRGYGVVAIETAPGRAEYARRQRGLAERAATLRDRLIDVTGALVARANA